MTDNQSPHTAIKQLAKDIRLIQEFTSTGSFDASLFNIEPSSTKNDRIFDTPVIVIIISTLSLLASTSWLIFDKEITPEGVKLCFVFALTSIVFASLAVQKKFSSVTMTLILVIGLSAALLLGAGTYSPREAAEIAQQYMGKEDKK